MGEVIFSFRPFELSPVVIFDIGILEGGNAGALYACIQSAGARVLRYCVGGRESLLRCSSGVHRACSQLLPGCINMLVATEHSVSRRQSRHRSVPCTSIPIWVFSIRRGLARSDESDRLFRLTWTAAGQSRLALREIVNHSKFVCYPALLPQTKW